METKRKKIHIYFAVPWILRLYQRHSLVVKTAEGLLLTRTDSVHVQCARSLCFNSASICAFWRWTDKPIMTRHTRNDMEPAFLTTDGEEAFCTKGALRADCRVLQLDTFIKFGMRKVLSQNISWQSPDPHASPPRHRTTFGWMSRPVILYIHRYPLHETFFRAICCNCEQTLYGMNHNNWNLICKT